MTEAEDTQWLRPGAVAARWGVSRKIVPDVAKRRTVRTKQLYDGGETRYHAGDVERAYREMLGEST